MALYFRTITFASCRYFEFTAAYGSAEGQIVSPGKKNEERGKTEVWNEYYWIFTLILIWIKFIFYKF